MSIGTTAKAAAVAGSGVVLAAVTAAISARQVALLGAATHLDPDPRLLLRITMHRSRFRQSCGRPHCKATLRGLEDGPLDCSRDCRSSRWCNEK